MGQKSNPFGMRLGINQTWNSDYLVSKKEQAFWLEQDSLIRDIFRPHRLNITRIKIKRTAKEVIVFLHTANCDLIAGENNQNLNLILQKIHKINENVVAKLNVIEEQRIYSSAQSIANLLAKQIEERTSFRLAVRQVLNKVNYQKDVKGIKIRINGRLDGSDIARHELFGQGSMPLNTLSKRIDYGQAEAKTIYGQVGVSAWICLKDQKRRNVNTQKKKI